MGKRRTRHTYSRSKIVGPTHLEIWQRWWWWNMERIPLFSDQQVGRYVLIYEVFGLPSCTYPRLYPTCVRAYSQSDKKERDESGLYYRRRTSDSFRLPSASPPEGIMTTYVGRSLPTRHVFNICKLTSTSCASHVLAPLHAIVPLAWRNLSQLGWLDGPWDSMPSLGRPGSTNPSSMAKLWFTMLLSTSSYFVSSIPMSSQRVVSMPCIIVHKQLPM